jgi:hypothetical protein
VIIVRRWLFATHRHRACRRVSHLCANAVERHCAALAIARSDIVVSLIDDDRRSHIDRAISICVYDVVDVVDERQSVQRARTGKICLFCLWYLRVS